MEIPLIFNEQPPLLGDGHGHYRIHIVGNSGASKLEQGSPPTNFRVVYRIRKGEYRVTASVSRNVNT